MRQWLQQEDKRGQKLLLSLCNEGGDAPLCSNQHQLEQLPWHIKGLSQEKAPDGEHCHAGCRECLVLLPRVGRGGLTCGGRVLAEVLSCQVNNYQKW